MSLLLLNPIKKKINSYKNVVTNGNFINGVTGWASNGTTHVVINGQLEPTETLTTIEHFEMEQITIAPIAFHKYYFCGNAYGNGGAIRLYNMQSGGAYDSTTTNTVLNTGVCSAIATFTTINATPTTFIRLYGKINSYLGTGVQYTFDNIIVIDLTAKFGTGCEPSKIWCDANISINNVQM